MRSPTLSTTMPTNGALIAVPIVMIVMPSEIDVLVHPRSCPRGVMNNPIVKGGRV